MTLQVGKPSKSVPRGMDCCQPRPCRLTVRIHDPTRISLSGGLGELGPHIRGFGGQPPILTLALLGDKQLANSFSEKR